LINRVRAKAEPGVTAVAAATIPEEKQVVITDVKEPAAGVFGMFGAAAGAVAKRVGLTGATVDAASVQELDEKRIELQEIKKQSTSIVKNVKDANANVQDQTDVKQLVTNASASLEQVK
jgi:uncharacterized membrane protein YdfJ with MMPL/SSD domain